MNLKIRDFPPSRCGSWHKVLGKIIRSPRTIWIRLGGYSKLQKQALQKAINNKIFFLESSRLRRVNPTAEGVVLNTRMGKLRARATLTSISHWANWSLTRFGFSGNLSHQPRIIYVKADPPVIKNFINHYLPLIHEQTRFVLITGDADRTIPRQVDKRFESYEDNGFKHVLESLMNDPRLLHWYAENLDTPLSKISPIPLGYFYLDGSLLYKQILLRQEAVPIRKKSLKAFCAHRVRGGAQWEERRVVTALAKKDWSEFVDYDEDIPYSQFFKTLQSYPFVLCVGGGGLDPSPKAWTSLMAGAIPVIERNPTTAAYADLPVAFVDRWEAQCLSQDQLRKWLDELHPYFEDPEQRRIVLEKMSMAHWLGKINSHFKPQIQAIHDQI